MSLARWWPWLRRGLTIGFFALVAWLLISQARQVEWAEVWTSMQQHSAAALAAAAGLALLSYGLYCSFDVMGKTYTGHGLPVPVVMTTAFISYAFNLNFGALVGGAGFRFRLYSGQGLDTADISRVLGLSMLGNWSGYPPLLGAVLIAGAISIPESWPLDADVLPWVGGVLIAVAGGYLALCAFSPRRRWSIRGHAIELPSAAMAGLQLVVSTANWMTIAAIPYLFLGQQVAYVTVLGILLIAAVAGVITHVPAGLGVLEAVFIALLGGDMPRSEVLAALLSYRAVYYLAPLALALVAFLGMEARRRRS